MTAANSKNTSNPTTPLVKWLQDLKKSWLNDSELARSNTELAFDASPEPEFDNEYDASDEYINEKFNMDSSDPFVDAKHWWYFLGGY